MTDLITGIIMPLFFIFVGMDIVKHNSLKEKMKHEKTNLYYPEELRIMKFTIFANFAAGLTCFYLLMN